jgi:hypothetical protein
MLIYEVNLEVDEDINYKVAGWLSAHIEKMLTFPGFKVAYWFFRQPEDENSTVINKILWTIQYIVEDRPSLDKYLKEHAKEIRKEAHEQFGEKMQASRRVLHLLNILGSPEAVEASSSNT